MSQHQLKEAEILYREALDIRIKNLSPNHPDISTSVNNLACFLQYKNRTKE
jgi:hypothetical protein